MKRNATILLVSGFAGLALVAAAQAEEPGPQPLLKPQLHKQLQPQVKTQPKSPAPKPQLPVGGVQAKPATPLQAKPLPLQPAACPDPAVQSFRVGRITSTPGPAPGYWPIYTIQLVAVVKNVGAGAYVTRPNQQALAIVERGSRTRDIKYQTFGDLAPGAQVVVSAQIRNWRRSTEFPPNYEAQIRYDPDITKDANPQNDDCRGSNNKRTITGAQINAAIDALPVFSGAGSMRR